MLYLLEAGDRVPSVFPFSLRITPLIDFPFKNVVPLTTTSFGLDGTVGDGIGVGGFIIFSKLSPYRLPNGISLS